jgi:3-methyl-2-oxobutanoate hydroxymethyltransferase
MIDERPCTKQSASVTRFWWIRISPSLLISPLLGISRMASEDRQVTIPEFVAWKSQGRRISVLTAYDFPIARIFDAAGVDCLLVGDSMGTTVQGRETTLAVTLEQTIYHSELVARAAKRALVVADLPFLSYQVSPRQAIRSAGRVLKETNCQAVKLEGGTRSARSIRALVDAEIPVMGHVGLTPQSIRRLGAYKVQRSEETIRADALAVADAGAFAVVLECIPAELASRITKELPIPTIGIGAGPGCDGQVLVLHDMLGLLQGFRPKFARRYAELGELIKTAAAAYVRDVQNGSFPADSESFR